MCFRCYKGEMDYLVICVMLSGFAISNQSDSSQFVVDEDVETKLNGL